MANNRKTVAELKSEMESKLRERKEAIAEGADLKKLIDTKAALKKAVDELNAGERFEAHHKFLEKSEPLFECIKAGTYRQWRLVDSTDAKGQTTVKVEDTVKRNGADRYVLKQVDVFYLNKLSVEEKGKGAFDATAATTHANALEQELGKLRALRTGKKVGEEDVAIQETLKNADEYLQKLFDELYDHKVKKAKQTCITGKAVKEIVCPLGKYEETLYTDVETLYGWAFKRTMSNTGNLTYEKIGNYRFFIIAAVAMLNSRINGRNLETIVGEINY